MLAHLTKSFQQLYIVQICCYYPIYPLCILINIYIVSRFPQNTAAMNWFTGEDISVSLEYIYMLGIE